MVDDEHAAADGYASEIAKMDQEQFDRFLGRLRESWLELRKKRIVDVMARLQTELAWLEEGGHERKGSSSPKRWAAGRARRGLPPAPEATTAAEELLSEAPPKEDSHG